jgi:hypothetical protein
LRRNYSKKNCAMASGPAAITAGIKSIMPLACVAIDLRPGGGTAITQEVLGSFDPLKPPWIRAAKHDIVIMIDLEEGSRCGWCRQAACYKSLRTDGLMVSQLPGTACESDVLVLAVRTLRLHQFRDTFEPKRFRLDANTRQPRCL